MTRKFWVPAIILLLFFLFPFLISGERLSIHLMEKNQAPSFSHLFGTDWLGRDMFFRTWKALQLSIGIGLLTAILSTICSFFMSTLAMLNQPMDRIISWLVDLFLSLPHLVTLLLISFTLDGGMKGVVIGLVLTHWPSLTRILRAEMLQLQQTTYVQMSKKLGKGFWWRAWHHFVPHILPQMLVGITVIFPHAILHEASITFLGFGLSAEQPAIGIILSESMQYLSSGMWWLAFFPGFVLLIVIVLFQLTAKGLRNSLEKDYSYGQITRN